MSVFGVFHQNTLNEQKAGMKKRSYTHAFILLWSILIFIVSSLTRSLALCCCFLVYWNNFRCIVIWWYAFIFFSSSRTNKLSHVLPLPYQCTIYFGETLTARSSKRSQKDIIKKEIILRRKSESYTGSHTKNNEKTKSNRI